MCQSHCLLLRSVQSVRGVSCSLLSLPLSPIPLSHRQKTCGAPIMRAAAAVAAALPFAAASAGAAGLLVFDIEGGKAGRGEKLSWPHPHEGASTPPSLHTHTNTHTHTQTHKYMFVYHQATNAPSAYTCWKAACSSVGSAATSSWKRAGSRCVFCGGMGRVRRRERGVDWVCVGGEGRRLVRLRRLCMRGRGGAIDWPTTACLPACLTYLTDSIPSTGTHTHTHSLSLSLSPSPPLCYPPGSPPPPPRKTPRRRPRRAAPI